MPRRAHSLARAIPTLALALVVAGCAPQPGGTGASSGPPASSGPTALTVGLGYIPSVQFAPFYLADQAGYYREAGLTVTFQNKIDPDLVTLVGQGAIDIGVADGTSVIPAVSQGIPIRYVATIYGTFPSIVFAKASSGIKAAADLRGRKLGIPGKYGSSWIMLQALLDSVHLTPDDLNVVVYPDFGQGVAVQNGAVDAATAAPWPKSGYSTIVRSSGVRFAEASRAWSMIQDEPYLPGIPSFLPFRSAAVLIPVDVLANTIDGNLP